SAAWPSRDELSSLPPPLLGLVTHRTKGSRSSDRLWRYRLARKKVRSSTYLAGRVSRKRFMASSVTLRVVPHSMQTQMWIWTRRVASLGPAPRGQFGTASQGSEGDRGVDGIRCSVASEGGGVARRTRKVRLC